VLDTFSEFMAENFGALRGLRALANGGQMRCQSAKKSLAFDGRRQTRKATNARNVRNQHGKSGRLACEMRREGTRHVEHYFTLFGRARDRAYPPTSLAWAESPGNGTLFRAWRVAFAPSAVGARAVASPLP